MSTPASAADGWVLSGQDSAHLLRVLAAEATRGGVQQARSARRWLGAVPGSAALARMFVPPGEHGARLRNSVAATIDRFRSGDEPVRLLIEGFPFKEQLRATGPLPDLAEAAALAGLRCLRAVVSSLHPAGLRVTILSDGGYYCRRPAADLSGYRRQLRKLLSLLAIEDFVEVKALAEVLRQALGDDTWVRRDTLVGAMYDEVRAAVEPARYAPRAARNRIERRGLAQFGVPSFEVIVRHYLRQSGPAAVEQAWRDAVQHLATAIVDERLGVAEALPPGLRFRAESLLTGALRLPCVGDLAASWNGTAFVDHRGRVRVGSFQALAGQCFVPVNSTLLAGDQPWFMIPVGTSRALHAKRPQEARLLAALAQCGATAGSSS